MCIVIFTLIHLVVFIITIWRVRRQLRAKSHSEFRAANILLQLQVAASV